MEYEIIKPPYREKCLGREFVVVMPVSANAPDFAKQKFRVAANPGRLLYALIAATSLDEANRAIDDYVRRVEAAVIQVGWGLLKVKIGKGASPASVKAKLECWQGDEPPADRYYDRATVMSEFYAPAAAVTPCSEKGYGLLSEYFVIKKLSELAARARCSGDYKRVPVASAVCPAGVLEAIREQMVACLPTQEDIDVATAAREQAAAERQAARDARKAAQSIGAGTANNN